jgi:pyrroline-5-carboxylate reductase
VEQVIATTGESLWVEAEEQLDAVTALSGRARPMCSSFWKP